jgi:hypothetical protein
VTISNKGDHTRFQGRDRRRVNILSRPTNVYNKTKQSQQL